jgi:hypothetical protein
MASVFFSNAQRIIAQIFQWLQSSAQTRIANLITDTFQTGIDKATDAGEGFLVVPGTNNTAASPTVNVTLGGIAYDPLGNRIFISSTDTTIYNAANPLSTTNDGLGNLIVTPQSTGVIDIPVTQNSANYIWIDYLATTNTSAFTLNEITNAKIFYEITDGYKITVTTVNVAPDVNSIFLASVTTNGSAVSSGQISQVGRTYYALLPGLISEVGVGGGIQYQLAYYPSTGTGVVGNPNTMAAAQVLVTDSNGVPTTTGNGSTTAAEIGFVHGVTSPIQPQLDSKFSAAGTGLTSSGGTVAIANGGVNGSTSNAGTQQQIAQGTVSTPDIRNGAINGSTSNTGTQQQIAQGTVSTVDLRANAVTQAVGSFITGSSFPGSFSGNIGSITITTLGGPIYISMQLNVEVQSSFDTNNLQIQLTGANGCAPRVINQVTGQNTSEFSFLACSSEGIYFAAAGTYTFTIQYQSDANPNGNAYSFSLNAIELRR